MKFEGYAIVNKNNEIFHDIRGLPHLMFQNKDINGFKLYTRIFDAEKRKIRIEEFFKSYEWYDQFHKKTITFPENYELKIFKVEIKIEAMK